MSDAGFLGALAIIAVALGLIIGTAWTSSITIERPDACPIFFEARDTVDVLREFPECVDYLPRGDR